MTVKIKCKVCKKIFECNGDILCNLDKNSKTTCWCEDCTKKAELLSNEGIQDCYKRCKGCKERVQFT